MPRAVGLSVVDGRKTRSHNKLDSYSQVAEKALHAPCCHTVLTLGPKSAYGRNGARGREVPQGAASVLSLGLVSPGGIQGRISHWAVTRTRVMLRPADDAGSEHEGCPQIRRA